MSRDLWEYKALYPIERGYVLLSGQQGIERRCLDCGRWNDKGKEVCECKQTARSAHEVETT